MRYVALIVASIMLAQPAWAEKAPEIDPRASLGVVQQWIYNYRAKPDYAHVPAAVRVLFHSQTFKEPENAGIYMGFIAGAIASNPAKAEQLVNSFFPVPPEDEWVIIRAIAYSCLPEWRTLLRKVAPKMPGRKVMIDAYLDGSLPILTEIRLEEEKPGMMDKLRGAFTRNPFAKEEKKVDTAKVRVFSTTPPYHDYNWTVRGGLPPELVRKLTTAFLELDARNPQQAEILALQRASRFVPTRPENYVEIEQAARAAKLLH